MKGAWVMFSTPTTRPISVLPSMTLWQAISMARIPEAQFWFTVTAELSRGRPMRMET